MKQCTGYYINHEYHPCEVPGPQSDDAFHPRYNFCKLCYNKKRNIANKAKRAANRPEKQPGFRQCPVCADFGLGPKPEAEFFATRSQCRFHIANPDLLEMEHEMPVIAEGMKYCIQCRRTKPKHSFRNQNPFNQTYCYLCESKIAPMDLIERDLFIGVYTYVADNNTLQIGGDAHSTRHYKYIKPISVTNPDYDKMWPNIFQWVGYDPNNLTVQAEMETCRQRGLPDASWLDKWLAKKNRFHTIVGRGR